MGLPEAALEALDADAASVWIEVQNEIDYETANPQDEWLGTSMHPVDAPK